MIGFIVAAGLGLVVLNKLRRQPGLTATNPQPAMLKPLPATAGGVGLAVMTAQPQMEQSRAAILAANVPYTPATTVVPDIGTAGDNLPLQAGDYSLLPPVKTSIPVTNQPTITQGPVSVEPVKAIEGTQMVGTLIDFGANLL